MRAAHAVVVERHRLIIRCRPGRGRRFDSTPKEARSAAFATPSSISWVVLAANPTVVTGPGVRPHQRQHPKTTVLHSGMPLRDSSTSGMIMFCK